MTLTERIVLLIAYPAVALSVTLAGESNLHLSAVTVFGAVMIVFYSIVVAVNATTLIEQFSDDNCNTEDSSNKHKYQTLA